MIWGNFQILSSIPGALGVNFPEPAGSFYAIISEITSLSPLNLISAACYDQRFASFEGYVLTTCGIFLFVSVLIWVAYLVRGSLRPARQILIYSESMWGFMFLTYLCYPSLSTLEFQVNELNHCSTCQASLTPPRHTGFGLRRRGRG